MRCIISKVCQNLISGNWSITWGLTMPCSGTAAWILRLTTWARAEQCCGGLKPLLCSVPLALVVGIFVGWPRVSYTFMCSRFPCLAALWKTRKLVGLTCCHFWINFSTKLCLSSDNKKKFLLGRRHQPQPLVSPEALQHLTPFDIASITEKITICKK